MSVQLKKEYQTYLSHRRDLINQHLDKYVLIKNNKIINLFESYESALRSGLKSFGHVPFFIRSIKEEEEVHFFHQGISR